MEINNVCKNYLDEDSPGYVVEYRGSFKEEISKVNYACGDIINDNLAIISVNEKDIDRLRKDVPSIVFIEARSIYVLQDIAPTNVDAIASVKTNNYLNLTGRGVIVGMIDTGIDYLNKEFIREDGTSRIIKIWDQSIQTNKVEGFYIGTEYKNEDLNRAIQASKSGEDPYKIVPSKDEIGHGTNMAGIIGARGYNTNIEGVANGCDFLVVKLLTSLNYKKILRENNLPEVPVYNNSEVLAAIEYLRKSAYELRRPIVIYLGVGSQNGSHDGYNITSRFITSISRLRDIVFVAGTGNSGDSEGHSTNFIRIAGEVGESELLITKEMKVFSLQVWINRPNKMSLNIIAPTGEESGFIMPNIQSLDKRQFYLLNTGVEIRCYDPESFTGHQLFVLDFKDIKRGVWRIVLRGEYVTNGRYDIWLIDKRLLPEGTKFLNPNPYNTLTIPSTAGNVITVAYYDGSTKSIVASSGKGFNTNYLINPDIATEGINILTVSAGNDNISKVSGSSAATAIVAGACALLLQWGIVDGNDSALYSIRLRSLLIYSASREDIYEYPNENLGYGKLNLQDVFRILGGNYRGDSNYLEYIIGGLFVRVSKEMINSDLGGRVESINSVYENFNTDNYSSYLIEYTGEIKSEIVDKLDIFLFKINEEYAVLFIRSDMINDFEDTLEVISLINSYFKGNNFEVIYVVPPDIYTLQQVSAIQASNVGMLQTELALNLTGKGVVVGIIDTGIDYLSNEFKDSNGNTRIDSILDQNLGLNKVNDNLILGNIYNKEQIDEAIRARDNGRDPYSIVPSKDEIGHGTNMAGIIGGTGKNPALKGVAPECEFVSVKLLEAKFLKKRLGIKEPIYNIASIFLAIEYLRRYHVESGKPMVILLPLGSNSGNHKGSHILDNYIASVSFNLGIVIVTGTGNEGAEDLHTSGIIKNIGDYSTIEMIVEKNQAILYMEIWMGVPDIIEVNVVSPSGLDTGYIPAILDIRKKYSFVFEQTKISIYYALPEEYSGDQLIRLYFYDIKPGIWNINVRLKLGRMAEYNAWLAQRALTLPGTRFISSTQYGTVTIPGDSRYAITVAAYNQNNNNLLSYSGVAFRDERNNAIDFAAGGYNTITVGPNNTIVTVSGTSLAAAVGAGACVLLFEWGIVNKNYPYMYSQTIKTFLTRGVYKRSGDIYPNPQLGYGIIDFYKIFENMS